jgi:hypothetical protein
VIAPFGLFNSAFIRLPADTIENPDSHYYFTVAGGSPAEFHVSPQTCLLDIPAGLTVSTVSLEPVSQYEDVTIPFSPAAFWPVSPQHRTHLSVPMKTKKRIRAVIETA